MNPVQKLKHLILIKDRDLMAGYGGESAPLPEITADNVDDIYELAEDADGEGWGLQDAREELRGGDYVTDLPCEWSRHYESKSVAARYLDGSWVGWTYWYGGGKHGEPESIDWLGDAYDLACVEEEKVVTVRTFAKATAEIEG